MQRHIRPIAAAIGLIALTFAYGCQSRDDVVLTEAERSIETAALDAETIIGMIEDLIGDPVVERSTITQFNNIVKAKTTAEKIKRAKSLFDYITKHYAGGKWVDAGGVKTGQLILAIGQFAGVFPDVEDAGAATCLPGNTCEATPTSEEGKVTIPSALVEQAFTLILTETDCSEFETDNVVPPCYDIQTFPEGITFDTSTSNSLSLSDFHTPFITLCSAFDEDDDFVVGTDIFLWHAHDGVIEQLETVPVPFCDDELSSQWANPLLVAFQPVLSILSPQPLYAAGGGTGLGSAISDFSQVASCLPGCFPTTTTISIVGGGESFQNGTEITFRVVVDPAPLNDEDPEALVHVRRANNGPLEAFMEVALEDGVAEHTFVCDGVDIGFGTMDANAAFFGTPGHETSESSAVQFACVE